jgi:hypothetical protein
MKYLMKWNRLVATILDVIAITIENMPVRVDTSKLHTSQSNVEFSYTGRSHIATPEGISTEKYCLDCLSKHLGTAKILMREALQRAEKGEDIKAILEKIRGAYEELMGAEDDSQALTDERIREFNTKIRDLRHWFFNSGVLVEADKNKIVEGLSKVSQLNDEVYAELEKRKHLLKEFIGKVKERIEKLESELNAQSGSAPKAR